MRNVFHWLLVALALVDLLVISLTILDVSIVRAFDVHFNWFFWAFPHLIYPTTNMVLTASIFLVVVIAYERYVAVCNPYDYRHTFAEIRVNNPEQESLQFDKQDELIDVHITWVTRALVAWRKNLASMMNGEVG